MNLIPLFFTGIAIGLSGAMIPGPLTLFTVSEVLKSNRFAGLKILSGHIVFEFVLILIIILGLKKFVNYGYFLSAVSMIGGMALIAMGVLLVLKAPGMRAISNDGAAGFNKGLFLGGVFFSVISPGFLIWWATIGLSTLIRALLYGVMGAVVLTLGNWLAVSAWQWIVSCAVDKGKGYLNDRAYRNTIRFFAVVLMVLGIHFVFACMI